MIDFKRLQKIIILFLIYYTLVIQGFMSLFGLSQVFLYLKDCMLVLAVAICFLPSIGNRNKTNLSSSIAIIPIFLVAFCIYSSVFNNVGIVTILIAIRKFFRGFVFMYLCIRCLSIKDVTVLIHRMYMLQIANMVLIIYQRIFAGYGQDHSNGIFGTGMTNNYNSVLCLILVCFCTTEYLYKKCDLKSWLMQLVVNFAIAMIAELKVLFFLIPVSILIILREKIFSRWGIKKILFIFSVFALALIGFGIMYSDQLNVLTSISGLKNYNNWGRTTSAIVNRKNWLTYTYNNIFGNNMWFKIMGVGFGTVTGYLHSSMFTSQYVSLGYGSYCLSTAFLETGIVGLVQLLLWFLLLWGKSFRKTADVEINFMSRFEQAFVLQMILFLFYSNFIYNDSCFLAFWGFAFVYIARREKGQAKQADVCNET